MSRNTFKINNSTKVIPKRLSLRSCKKSGSVQQSLGTPILDNSNLAEQLNSANCRPYRLSLNRRLCESMSRKRLTFHIANELEKAALETMEVEDRQQTASKCETSRKESLEKTTAGENLKVCCTKGKNKPKK